MPEGQRTWLAAQPMELDSSATSSWHCRPRRLLEGRGALLLIGRPKNMASDVRGGRWRQGGGRGEGTERGRAASCFLSSLKPLSHLAFVHVVVWRRIIPYSADYLNTWSQVGVFLGKGCFVGKTLLEKVSNWGVGVAMKSLTARLPACSLFLAWVSRCVSAPSAYLLFAMPPHQMDSYPSGQ